MTEMGWVPRAEWDVLELGTRNLTFALGCQILGAQSRVLSHVSEQGQ